jgi:hypothetical protein
MKEYYFKNIRKNEETLRDDESNNRFPRIQLELVIPPNNEEVTIWFPKDNRTHMVKESNVIYVMDEELVAKIDKEIAEKIKPVEVRRVKPRRRSHRSW